MKIMQCFSCGGSFWDLEEGDLDEDLSTAIASSS